MRKFECPRCHKKITPRERRQNGKHLSGEVYCEDCYRVVWESIVEKLINKQGLFPQIEITTDECTECEGTGRIEYGGSHSWFEDCEKCKGTGKEWYTMNRDGSFL